MRLNTVLCLLVLSFAITAAFAIRDAAISAQEPEPFAITFARGGEAAFPGEEVTFTVNEPKPGATYIWVFGDGSPPVTGARVAHAFATVKEFTVLLDASQGGRQERAGSRTVRVIPEMAGAFAADVDGQITPADLFYLTVAVRVPGVTRVTVRLGGPLLAARTEAYEVDADLIWLLLPDTRIVNERDSYIAENLLQKPGAELAMSGGRVTLTLEYVTASGARGSQSYQPDILDFNEPERTAAVTYPRIHAFTGLPPEGQGEDDYYLLGNPDFSHVEDWYVRRLAVEWGRRGEAWPDDPHTVAMNLYRTIDSLLGDGDPGLFNNDYNFARLFEDGSLSKTRKNGEYICIAQTYFFTGLARTLGFPAREINNAIGAPARQRPDGVWIVSWWQEAGLELWYGEGWHYFDTWLGFTSRDGYLQKNLIYQSWAAYNRQTSEFRTVRGEATGMRGHNFSAWPGDPPQWSFLEEGIRPGITVDGMVGDPPAAPISALPRWPLNDAVVTPYGER
jgi:hypothetical protein